MPCGSRIDILAEPSSRLIRPMQIYLPVAELSLNAYMLLGMGLAIGVLSGMFGIGGGFILTTFMIFIGVPPGIAVDSGIQTEVAVYVSSELGYMLRDADDLYFGI